MLGEAAARPDTHRIWGYKAFPAASDCCKIPTLLRKHKEGNSVCLYQSDPCLSEPQENKKSLIVDIRPPKSTDSFQLFGNTDVRQGCPPAWTRGER